MNSTGSVTPGQERGQAQRQQQPRDAGAALRPGRVIHGETGPGRPNIMTGKKPDMNAPAVGIAGEESLQIAGGAVIVADDEPREIIQNVMQPGDDQYSIQDAIGEQAERPRAQDGLAGRIHSALQIRPRIAHDRSQHQAGQPADDGHEAPAAEKAQVARQGDVAEPVVADAGDDAGQQSDRDAELVAREPGGAREQRFDGARGHQKTDHDAARPAAP